MMKTVLALLSLAGLIGITFCSPAHVVGKLAEPEENIHFYLYTRENPDVPDVLIPNDAASLANSHYNPNAPLKIVCHGYTHSSDHPIGVEFKKAFIEHAKEELNVIIMDWRVLAQGPLYDRAAENTRIVGKYAAELIEFLIASGVTELKRIHYIGHSLGSHIGGFITNSLTSGRPARISALDPALPLFGAKEDDERIDPTDADFVDVIHVAGGTLLEGGLAFKEPRGHVDFYPNGGEPKQPGCSPDLFGICSHDRCFHFYVETLLNPTAFPAYQCESWEEYDSGACVSNSTEYMGEYTPATARGLYFLRTNAESPYGQGQS